MRTNKTSQTRRDFLKIAGVTAGTLPLINVPNYLWASSEAGIDVPSKGAVVRVVDGFPQVFVNGESTSRMWGRLALPAELAVDKLKQYSPAGIQVYFTAIDRSNALCWDGEDQYDYRPYEIQLERLIKAKPDIQLILYVGVRDGAPYRWVKAHQDELLTLHTGQPLMAASFGSQTWLDDSLKAYAKFVQYFENSRFADNIIGYNPISNSGNEWWGYGGSYEEGLADYSPAMEKHFRNWLEKKYGNDETKLRKFWKDKNVSFETAKIPTAEQRMEDKFVLLAEKNGWQAADFYRCFNEANANRAILTCKTIKENLTTPKLVGLMFGYSYARGRYRGVPQMQGHGEAKRLFECEYVDFFQSPYDYQNRSFGGPHFSQHAVNSILENGKAMIDQIDTKTHLRYPPNRNAETPWQSEQILKRDAVFALTRNHNCYWFEGGPGNMVLGEQHSPINWCPMWYDSPEIKKLIGELKKLTDKNTALKSEDTAEVALVTSNESNYYRMVDSVYGAMFVQAQRNWEIMKIGTHFDDYLLEDFEKIRRKYKVYVFMNALYVSSDLRKKIKEKLKEDEATAIWFYGSGYYDENGGSLKNCEDLIGIKLNYSNDRDYLQVEKFSSSDAIFKNIDTIKSYGSDVDTDIYARTMKWQKWPSNKEDYKFSPIFYAEDNAAKVLGRMRKVDRPGLVVKKADGFTSVFSGAPNMPWQIMGNIFTQAGVHRFSTDGDLIYANSKFISVVSLGKDDKKTIQLPEKYTINDALTNEVLGRKTKEFTYQSRYGETRIFELS